MNRGLLSFAGEVTGEERDPGTIGGGSPAVVAEPAAAAAAGSEAEGGYDTEERQGPRPTRLASLSRLALPLPPILHLVQDPGARFRARFPAKQVMEDTGLEVDCRGRGEKPLSS